MGGRGPGGPTLATDLAPVSIGRGFSLRRRPVANPRIVAALLGLFSFPQTDREVPVP
jgi:hypothetical protein